MASQRVNDFVVKGFGGEGNGDVAEFPGVFDFIEKAKYDAAKARFGSARTLTCIRADAAADVDKSIRQVFDIIKRKTNGRLETIGSFCAIGASNSSALVLGLAAKLKSENAPQLGYLGLVDLPMFPFGRLPPLATVGPLRPMNPPDYANPPPVPQPRPPAPPFPMPPPAAPPIQLRSPYFNPWSSPLVAPNIDLGAIVDAKTKRNFYQVEGNRWELVKRSPPPVSEFLGRWWTSDMPGNEVHGTLTGWDNVRVVVTAGADLQVHVGFCGRDDTWGQAKRDASQAVTEFPP